jgi:cell division protein FtsZ
MSLNLKLPEKTVIKPQITVFGVGGAGGNATNNMIRKNLQGANFVVANTDAQALEYAESEKRIQLGQNTTQGLGAGAAPEVGSASAEEAAEEIKEHLQGSHMVFITAGMGGGTGTGAAPVIAKLAREAGILTVGVVTKPFHFEGTHRMKLAEAGIAELQQNVDTLIIIPNQNLFRIANEKTTFADAFAMADEVLYRGVRSITDLMIMPGLINLDFADVKAVMTEMGKAMMGTGEADGERRAEEAANAAISNPLLDNTSMKGARGVLINITGGPDMTLFEVDEAANRIREEVDESANIIFGSTFDESLEGKIRVSVVATGIGALPQEVPARAQQQIASAPTTSHPQPQNIASEEGHIQQQAAAPSFMQQQTAAPQGFQQQTTPHQQDHTPAATSSYETQESPSFHQSHEGSLEEQIPAEPNDGITPPKVFVSRAPIEPNIHSSNAFEQQQPAIHAQQQRQNHQPDSLFATQQQDSIQKGGFFSKMAEVAKSTFKKSDMWDEQVERELHSIKTSVNTIQEEELETVSGGGNNKESFDIPAFLRRKPNQ